jgi:sialate O-acetylesterase
MKPSLAFFTTLALALSAPLSAAELKLAALFSDHMVLQRDKPVPIWGWSDPDEKITVEFAGQKKSGVAGTDGRWHLKLDPLAASAESRVLKVSSDKADRKIKITDVLVGEVWLGSGQSNMAMRVSAAMNFGAEQTSADLPAIRTFNEGSGAAAQPQADAKGTWVVCSPETVGGFSATLYFFGREIHRELGVPVGLINSSVGGTPIEAWIAPEAQADGSGQAEKEAAMKANHEKALARWKSEVAKARKEGKPAPPRPHDTITALKKNGGPGGLFNGKIAPLVPFALRGVLWYQGEANTHPDKGARYQHQLPLLVEDWRKHWGEELPFAWVQLPNYNRPGEGWSLVREGMLKSLRLPKTGMAIALDLGDAKDIHPKNKQEVGRRLSFWALGTVYGRKVPAVSGPLPVGHEIQGDSITVTFKHTEGGLVFKEGQTGAFAIAGKDKQWKPARAKIEGDKLILSSPEVAAPVAARYAWASVAPCELFNGAGLPASPFRTDDWPVESAAATPSKR